MFSLIGRRGVLGAAILFFGAITGRVACAQGMAGASVRGTVVTRAETPIAGATIVLTNLETGVARATTSMRTGAFRFDNIGVGGAYRVEVRAVGFEALVLDGLALELGDRVVRQFVLTGVAARELERVVVRASPLTNAGAGGPVYTIPFAATRALPLINRNVAGLLTLSPQATGTGLISIGGMHPRFNTLRVDGGTNDDAFGAAAALGSSAGGGFISLEAIDGIRIMTAPFDVRYGGFSGGLVNAVTRSGTNQHRESVFMSMARTSLVGGDSAGTGVAEFSTRQYGLSASGPIITNKLHYFAAAEVQSSRTQFVGSSVSDPAIGIGDSTARRAAEIFREQYGFDPGGAESPVNRQPFQNLFAKLSWATPFGSMIEASHTFGNGTFDNLGRPNRNRITREGWQLSKSGFENRARASTTRARMTSAFGSVTNEALASLTTITNASVSTQSVPLFLVQGTIPNVVLAAGSVRNSQDTETDQRIVEVADNLTVSQGTHLFTIGVQSQFIRIRDTFFPGQWGAWTFASVDALEQRTPVRYEIALPLRAGGPLADYPLTQVAGYVQDHWSATRALTITGGVRLDVPFFKAPQRNDALFANDLLGNIDTHAFPSGNAVVSPRAGFSYDVFGGRAMLRGGIGAFAGRPPLAWLTTAYANTGNDQATLVCTPETGVPAPTTDLAQLPTQCTGSTQPARPVPSVTYFASDFRFQRAVKVVLGADVAIQRGLTASLDVTQTQSHDEVFVTDVNLVPAGTNAEERAMYGTIPVIGATRPQRADPANFGAVYLFRNGAGARSTSVTASLNKRWGSEGYFYVGYTGSTTRDVMSLSGLNGAVMFQSNPIDGTLAQRTPRRSARDIPHNAVIASAVPVGRGFTASIFLHLRSGTPYAYVNNGDANADGSSSNDLAYIPRDSADITLTNPAMFGALSQFVDGESCLRRQRGHIMQRNSCRNPSVFSLDMRIARTIGVRAGRIELWADVFNVPQLLNKRWGVVRQATATEGLTFLTVSGWDTQNNRPRYTVPTVNGSASFPALNQIVSDASRWRMQLGARYTFQ